MRRLALVLGALALVIGLGGCKTARCPELARTPAPEYAEIAASYNGRLAEIPSLWARATVEVHFEDEEGDRRWEQGNGHLQVARPSRFALSVGKFGEVLYWIGCDQSRFWFLDMEENAAAVGTLDGASRVHATRLGLPASPDRLFGVLGLSELPEPGAGRRDPRVRRSDDGCLLVVEVDDEWGRTTYFLDPETFEAERVELVGDTGETVVTSELSEYSGVRLPDRVGHYPRLASFAIVRDLRRDTEIKIRLGKESMEWRELPSQVFDLEALLDAYDIERVRDLDAERSPEFARHRE